jgi:hypothetical protein
MIDFRTFESLGKPVEPEYLREPQGMMKRSAAVQVWNKIGVGNSKISGKGVFCVDYLKLRHSYWYLLPKYETLP